MNDKKNVPNFLGIGMERAGTSWLFKQISAHPDIWIPPLKELHFFDVIDPKAKYLTHRYSYHLKSRIKQKAAPFLNTRHRPEFSKNNYLTYLLWDFYYFVGRFNTNWYKRLFSHIFTKGRVCGEITPAYSNLTPETIDLVLSVNPDMKFLLMVRNPRERLWSGVVHHFRHVLNKPFGDVTDKEIIDYLKGSAAKNRSDLGSMLRTWFGAVPKENLLIHDFLDMKEAPEKIIKRTYEFLGVSSEYMPPENFYLRKVNDYTCDGFVMSDDIASALDRITAPMMAELRQEFPDIVKNW